MPDKEPLITKKEFFAELNHFYECVNFNLNTLDARAISFMNIMPGRISKVFEAAERGAG